jgi:hypothetical protein
MNQEIFVLFLIFLVFYCAIISGQNLRAKRRPRRERESNDGKLFKALQVLYPLRFFNPTLLGEDFDWRLPGSFNEQLAKESEANKAYVEIARAQDMEDVWLYENWFYGIKNGIIIESGALDGMLFSTSYMYETFANWTAIHVGKAL